MIDIMKFLYYNPSKELSFLNRNQDIFYLHQVRHQLPFGGLTPIGWSNALLIYVFHDSFID